MKLSADKILLAAIPFVILVIVFILVVSLRQSRRLKDTAQAASHTEQVLLHTQRIVKGAVENETGARGFVITGKEEFLEPANQSLKEMYDAVDTLKRIIADSDNAKQWTDTFVRYIDERARISDSMIGLRRQYGFETAATLVATGVGKQYTDRIRQMAAIVEQSEEARLHQIKSENDKAIRQMNMVLYGVLVGVLLLSIIIIHWIRTVIVRQRVNERKFLALLDAAPDATVIVDQAGIIRMANLQSEQMFGYSRNELIGKRVEVLIPDDLHARHLKHREAFGKMAKARSMGAGIELKAIRKDKTPFPVEISLSPIQTNEGLLVSAAVRDITDRKKSEEKFRSLLNSAPDATVIVGEDGRIQMINHQTENLFGYSREELVGQRVEMLIPAELHDRHKQHRSDFVKAARVRSMGAGIQLNAVKKGGQRFPVEISLSPIQTEEGLLVSAAIRDVTTRQRLEDELKKSNAELEAFTYSVSHDLRAPLRGIIGFTAILEEDYTDKLDDEARRITGVIKNNTMRMGHLIDDLLAFSRLGRQEVIKTSVNMTALINDIITEMQSNENMPPVDWVIHELPVVYADINLLRQVGVNLVSNAIKYSGNRERPRIEIGSFNHEGQTAFYIKDNGVGFDDKYKNKLFKVFQRLHTAQEFEGTGVGLALVEKIVSRHGGKVWAEATLGEGAIFYFSLPD
jgi:PAS domain S-box-containing protein